MGLCVWSLLCDHESVLSVLFLSSFAIILLRKRELVVLLELYPAAVVWVLVFCVSAVRRSVVAAFSGHARLLLDK